MAMVRWRPDTCECVIEGDFDTYVVQHISPCDKHKHLPPPEAFAAAHRDNRLRASAPEFKKVNDRG